MRSVEITEMVGSVDPFVVDACRDAARKLCSPSRVAVVPGATHAFAEEEACVE
jgi:dienelactone hydrolase